MKVCSIIYFAGTGGNFLRYCLSLSPETVPYLRYNLKRATPEQISQAFELTTDQRREIVDFATLEDFLKLHSPVSYDMPFEAKYLLPVEPDFYYENAAVNNHWTWAIVTNHPDNYHERLPYLSQTMYVDLDLMRYGSWVRRSYEYFTRQGGYFGNFSTDKTYRLTPEQEQQATQVKSLPNGITVSMTRILDSKQGFVAEYQRVCEALKITPVDQALDYYQHWYNLRVEPFI